MEETVSDSWEESSSWYDRIVGEKGHYFHEKVILPALLPKIPESARVLDLACGQGILARNLPHSVTYLGVDASPSLIRSAQNYNKRKDIRFLVADLAKPLPLKEKFTHATVILALQNLSDPLPLLKTAHAALEKEGKLIIVMNHPCFRIPRQSSWGVDEAKKMQYRRIDRYFFPLSIPIQTHPGKESSAQTTSYHHPLSTYSRWLKEAGFLIEEMEEWCSDKKSTGPKASMENRCRQEFPLFLSFSALKR